jgi:hypothetical protein
MSNPQFRFNAEDFARARGILVENPRMVKRGVCAVTGFILFCVPSFAQQTNRPARFSALNKSLPQFASLDLSNAQSFSYGAFTWTEPTPDFLPGGLPVPARPRTVASPALPTDSSKEVVDVSRPLFDYAHGEIGFLYGRSTGKFSRELEQGYIMGEVGSDKFQISAGAAYERSTGRVPRLRH